MAQPIRFRVVATEAGTPVARLLERRLSGVDLERCRALVRDGAVYIADVRVRTPTLRVAAGQRVTVYLEAIAEASTPEVAVDIVHRDEGFVVVEKPPGVPVAATRSSAVGTLSDALRRLLEREGVSRPYVGVVHRLDRGASGLVLFTTRSALNPSLHRQFVEHRIERTYRVLVDGDPPPALRCDAPLYDLPGGRGTAVARAGEPGARPATTHFERRVPCSPRPGTALLDVQLVTGRTHQIRVHAQSLGFPVRGDARYGDPVAARDERLFLHAYRLAFAHPISSEPVVVRGRLPAWAEAREDEPRSLASRSPDDQNGMSSSPGSDGM